MSCVSNFPSSDLPNLLLGCKSPLVLIVFGAEPNLSPIAIALMPTACTLNKVFLPQNLSLILLVPGGLSDPNLAHVRGNLHKCLTLGLSPAALGG